MGTNIRLLVVDDDERIGKMLKNVLAEEGVDVEYVTSGETAVEKLRSEKYDVVFLDIIMPGLNGVETLERIREFNKEIRVVMITGYSVHEMLEKAMSIGAHASLTKPVDIAQIVEVIKKVTGKDEEGKEKKKNCLVIDERQTTENLLYGVLSEAGFSVSVSTSCKDTVAKKDYLPADLIIINIDLNDTRNRDACAVITEQVSRERIIVLLDTSEEEALMEKAFGQGVRSYLPASSSKEEFLRVLGKGLP